MAAPTFTAVAVSAPINHEGYLGVIRVQPAEVSLDDAALLMNDLIGGPVVWIQPDRVEVLPVTGNTRRWRLITVTADVETEACDILRQVGELAVEGKLDPATKLLPRAYRWHDGQLKRVIWKEQDGTVGAVGQAEWAD